MNIDYDLLTFCLCTVGIVLIALYAISQIIKDAIDKGIAHYNEKPTAKIIQFKQRGDSNE